jgi:2-iminobutanoate/2-iminopropanoate deaminase
MSPEAQRPHPVRTSLAPTPAGHYSQGIVHGGLVYVAGQLPIAPERPDAEPGTTEEQVRRTFANVGAILEAAGSSLQHLLHVSIFVSDLSIWGDVNRVYAELLGDHRPARAVIPCGELKRGCLLEVTAVAAVAADPVVPAVAPGAAGAEGASGPRGARGA